jgi:hypothetical protein
MVGRRCGAKDKIAPNCYGPALVVEAENKLSVRIVQQLELKRFIALSAVVTVKARDMRFLYESCDKIRHTRP